MTILGVDGHVRATPEPARVVGVRVKASINVRLSILIHKVVRIRYGVSVGVRVRR